MPDRNSPTRELEDAVEEFYRGFPYPAAKDFALRFANDFDAHCARKFGKAPPVDLGAEIVGAVVRIYLDEAPPSPFERQTHTDPIAHARYRDFLLGILRIKDIDHASRLERFKTLLTEVFEPLVEALPPAICITLEHESPETPPEPLLSLIPDAEAIVHTMLTPLLNVHKEAKLFRDYPMGAFTGAIIAYNIENHRLPSAETPLTAVLEVQVPAPPPLEEPEPTEPDVDERHWYRHALLLATTGGGKTNVIRWRISKLLPALGQGRASLIVMEPKGVLTAELLALARDTGLEHRTIFIDPGDPAISVNLFENGDGSPQAINETVGRVSRVFNTITATLTPFQRNTLTFALRAMLALPDPASIRTLTAILRKGVDDRSTRHLSFAVREFFTHDFKPGDGRAAEIIARLNGLLGDPVFETLFAAEETTFDILREMQAGKLVVINASGADRLYGRFWIEEIARTIRPRLSLPFERRIPTTFIIDEAQEYIAEDLHFAEILDQAREARLGIFLAAHHMGQITNDHVRNSLYTNTALKFTAKTSADIFNLCRSMGTTEPAFISTLNEYEFAFFGPNMPAATRVRFPLVSYPPASPQSTAFFKHRHRDPAQGEAPFPGPPTPMPAAIPAEVQAVAPPSNPPDAEPHPTGTEGASDWG